MRGSVCVDIVRITATYTQNHPGGGMQCERGFNKSGAIAIGEYRQGEMCKKKSQPESSMKRAAIEIGLTNDPCSQATRNRLRDTAPNTGKGSDLLPVNELPTSCGVEHLARQARVNRNRGGSGCHKHGVRTNRLHASGIEYMTMNNNDEENYKRDFS